MIPVETRMRDTLLVTVSMGTLFLNRLTRRFLRTRLRVNAVISASVVVLTPPPHEPGDAPKNIKKIIMARVASLSDAISIVLKPAVRQVMD